MIYYIRNWSNDTTESQKEKRLFSVQPVKNHGTKITYTSQFVLMSCRRRFVMLYGTASLVLFLACS